MKPIEQGELYQHLSGFLKKKGVELHEGPYPGRLEQVCRLLTETINATQGTLERARKGVDRGFEQVRQVLKKKRSGGSKSGSVVSAAMEAGRNRSASGEGEAASGEGEAARAERKAGSGKGKAGSAKLEGVSGKRGAVRSKVKVAKPKREKKKVAAVPSGVKKGKKKAVSAKRKGLRAEG
ncbi:MAG: hypothetical protein RI897_4650 [Verrucomicrobiota bacterium]|jgi:hypothetical protein